MANECDVLERKPTEIDLADVAKVSGGNWKRLLTYLGVPYNQTVAFHANSSQNVQNACFDGLMCWHKGNAVVDGGPSPVTYSKLLQSMEDAEMRSMAKEKREKIIIKQYKPVVNTLQPSPGDVLERKPTETDLTDVANVSGGNWKRLLTYLGVPYNKTVTFLVSNNQKVNDACFEGLMYWSEGNAVVDGEPSPVTYSKLLNSMEDADMRSTAEEMRKKIVKQYKPVVNTLQPSPGAGSSTGIRTPVQVVDRVEPGMRQPEKVLEPHSDSEAHEEDFSSEEEFSSPSMETGKHFPPGVQESGMIETSLKTKAATILSTSSKEKDQ